MRSQQAHWAIGDRIDIPKSRMLIYQRKPAYVWKLVRLRVPACDERSGAQCAGTGKVDRGRVV